MMDGNDVEEASVTLIDGAILDLYARPNGEAAACVGAWVVAIRTSKGQVREYEAAAPQLWRSAALYALAGIGGQACISNK